MIPAAQGTVPGPTRDQRGICRGFILAIPSILLFTSCGAVSSGPGPLPSALTSPPTPVASTPLSVPAEDTCHPGGAVYCVLNPSVTQANIATTVCHRGWTATIRPPAALTDQLKRQQLAAEHLPYAPAQVEEDHRMPLELGGHPTEEHNLSPQYPRSPNPKDTEESQLRARVCAGEVTLVQAQQQLVSDWLKPWPEYTR